MANCDPTADRAIQRDLELARKLASEDLQNFCKNICSQSGCIYLLIYKNIWIALDKDPCPQCKDERCNNARRPFDEKDRLLILEKQ